MMGYLETNPQKKYLIGHKGQGTQYVASKPAYNPPRPWFISLTDLSPGLLATSALNRHLFPKRLRTITRLTLATSLTYRMDRHSFSYPGNRDWSFQGVLSFWGWVGERLAGPTEVPPKNGANSCGFYG